MTDQHRSPSSFLFCALACALLVGCGAQPGGGGGDGTGGASPTGTGGSNVTGAGGGGGGNGGATGNGGTTGGTGNGGATGSGGIVGTGTGGAAGRGGAGGSGGTATGGSGGTTATGAGGTAGTGAGGNGGMMGGGTGGIAGSGVPTMTTTFTCSPQTWDTVPIGFATQSGGTTGGGSGTAMVVTSLSALNTAAGGTATRVIQLNGKVSGTVTVGSNKTILGGCGAEIDGHVQMSGSSNVIMRNIKVVGLNCTDNSDCQSGLDSLTIDSKSTHLWFDHLDVSNGSDGNLDITQASDFVTVSWTKFSYSGQRAGGHQFSNLIGASDTDTSDTGHLRVTWHHNWWGANVGERMPRARFGDVHVFNNLYTATGDNACIEVGVSANMLIENNFFTGVSDPIDTLDYSNSSSIAITKNNEFTNISGMFAGLGSGGFTPPYSYNLDGAGVISAEIMAGAGVK